MTTPANVIAANLRRLRGDRTQEQVASMLGVYLRTYVAWELAEHAPPATRWSEIARVMGARDWHELVTPKEDDDE